MDTAHTLVQRRLADGLEYHFVRDGVHEGRPSFVRADAKVLVRWHPGSGWVACDRQWRENGWSVFPTDTPLPTEGPVYSHKGEKSYTYCLILDPERFEDLTAEATRMLRRAAETHTAADLDPRMPDFIRDRVVTELGLA